LIHILHVGRNESPEFFYYVMECGDDETKGQAIDPERYRPRSIQSDLKSKGRLSLVEALDIVLPVTEGLEFLHANGLIHRDIKPANIIFVHDRPKLADIGLVTRIGTSESEVSFVGTRGYMPPEGPSGPSGDLYSLGKLLYVMLTARHVQEFPTLPPEIESGPEAKLVLAAIQLTHRLCSPDATTRYQSAADLLAALRPIRDEAT